MEQQQEKSPIKQWSLAEVGALLVKDCNLHEGLYDVAVELQIAVGQVGPTQETALPGAIVGVSKFGLIQAEKVGPLTIDAAVSNPKKSRSRKISEK